MDLVFNHLLLSTMHYMRRAAEYFLCLALYNTAEHRQTVQPDQNCKWLSLPKECLNGNENDQFKKRAPHGTNPKSDSLHIYLRRGAWAVRCRGKRPTHPAFRLQTWLPIDFLQRLHYEYICNKCIELIFLAYGTCWAPILSKSPLLILWS